MFEILYAQAAHLVIATLLAFIGVHTPERTEPLTWPEVQANIDDMANKGNRPAMEMIVLDTFKEVPTQALGILGCENPSWDPRAHSRTDDYGIFQLNGVHWYYPSSLGYGMDPFSVRDNATVARRLYDGRGWVPWSCRGAAR